MMPRKAYMLHVVQLRTPDRKALSQRSRHPDIISYHQRSTIAMSTQIRYLRTRSAWYCRAALTEVESYSIDLFWQSLVPKPLFHICQTTTHLEDPAKSAGQPHAHLIRGK